MASNSVRGESRFLCKVKSDMCNAFLAGLYSGALHSCRCDYMWRDTGVVMDRFEKRPHTHAEVTCLFMELLPEVCCFVRR